MHSLFDSLKAGDKFIFNKNSFIKIRELPQGQNAVELSGGYLVQIMPSVEVEVLGDRTCKTCDEYDLDKPGGCDSWYSN